MGSLVCRDFHFASGDAMIVSAMIDATGRTRKGDGGKLTSQMKQKASLAFSSSFVMYRTS